MVKVRIIGTIDSEKLNESLKKYALSTQKKKAQKVPSDSQQPRKTITSILAEKGE